MIKTLPLLLRRGGGAWLNYFIHVFHDRELNGCQLVEVGGQWRDWVKTERMARTLRRVRGNWAMGRQGRDQSGLWRHMRDKRVAKRHPHAIRRRQFRSLRLGWLVDHADLSLSNQINENQQLDNCNDKSELELAVIPNPPLVRFPNCADDVSQTSDVGAPWWPQVLTSS